MSDQMFEIDFQNGVEMGWHKKTNVMSSQMIAQKGFGYELANSPMGYLVGDKFVADPDYYRIVSSDNNLPIGKPIGLSFGYLTNTQFLQIAINSLAGTGAQIVSLGTFDSRKKRYISVRIGEQWESFKIGNREFKNLLNLQDAIDGTMPLIAKGSNICIVCANTFGYSLNEKSEFQLSLRHSKNHNSEEKIDNIINAIDAYRGATALVKKTFESAESQEIAKSDARLAFAGFVGEGEKMATRTQNISNRLLTLFNEGAGNNGRTGLDLISAVTDYYSHESAHKSRGVFAQETNSLLGNGAKAKDKFVSLVTKNNRIPIKGSAEMRSVPSWDKLGFSKLCELGEKSLSETSKAGIALVC